MAIKKAVFAYSFSARNAGDFSLNIAAVDILIRNGYFVTVISRFGSDEPDFSQTSAYFNSLYGSKVEMIGSPFKLDRSANPLVRFAHALYGGLTLLGLQNKRIKNKIESSDLVVLCGGNILRCGRFADYMRLLALDYPLSIARKLNKKYIIFPQSTADVNLIGRPLLGKMLNNAEVSFIRERLSFERLKKLYPSANLQENIDLAFFLLEESRFKKSSAGKKRIAFTIRAETIGSIDALPDYERRAIVDRIKVAALSLSKYNDLYFIVQGAEGDREITQLIKDELLVGHSLDIPVLEEHDTFSLIELYSSFDLLIGMRLHSIILAAIAGTPSYGFFLKQWGFKNPGILDQLGLPYSFVDDGCGINIDKVDEFLCKKAGFQSHVSNLVATKRGVFSTALEHSR